MPRSGRMDAMARGTTAGLGDYEQRYREILGELTEIGFIRSGSVAPRYNYCGIRTGRTSSGLPRSGAKR